MKIYIAGPWDERERARDLSKRLVALGHTIAHDWWDHDVPDNEESKLIKCANDDFIAVGTSDVFILLNSQPRGQETSGKAVELGIALMANALIGAPRILATGIRGTNIFQLLPEVEWFDSLEALIGQID